MKSLGYIGAFLGGAIAGAALGILLAPEKGSDTREKLTDAIDDFLKKHNIKLNHKDVGDLVDDIQDVTEYQKVMLSSDKNVETIAQLIEVLKNYLSLQTEFAKLTVIDKVVRLLTALALAITLAIIAVAVLLFFWLSVGFWLATYIGMAASFLIIMATHLLLLIIFYVFRKSWIERPLVRFLADLLMS